MGEQGAESIHAHLNRLDKQLNGIVNPLHRLKYIIKDHIIESLPRLNSLQPLPKNTKKTKSHLHSKCSNTYNIALWHLLTSFYSLQDCRPSGDMLLS